MQMFLVFMYAIILLLTLSRKQVIGYAVIPGRYCRGSLSPSSIILQIESWSGSWRKSTKNDDDFNSVDNGKQ